MNNATAVLMDFLNTGFDYTGYERVGVTNLLRSLAQTDSRVALYTLGENLHMLHDFTDNSQKLVEIAAKLDQKHSPLPSDLKSALRDFGDLMTLDQDETAAMGAAVHARMTENALKLIIERLSGVPGRKNLVWLMDDPRNVPPAVTAMLLRANIVLYPVLVRTVRTGDPDQASSSQKLLLPPPAAGHSSMPGISPSRSRLRRRIRTRLMFSDTTRLPTCSTGSITRSRLRSTARTPDKQTLEVHYRPGYLATKVAIPAAAPSPEELYDGRVNSARIGLMGQATLERATSGFV